MSTVPKVLRADRICQGAPADLVAGDDDCDLVLENGIVNVQIGAVARDAGNLTVFRKECLGCCGYRSAVQSADRAR